MVVFSKLFAGQIIRWYGRSVDFQPVL